MKRLHKRGSSRSGRIFLILTLIAAAAGTLHYFEQYIVLYIASGVALIVLALMAVYSKFDDAAIHASEEAFMTRRSEGIMPGDVMLSHGATATAGIGTGRRGPDELRKKQETI